MIESITLKNVATYSNEQLSGLKISNYIYGCNGSGKTTISRVIKNIEAYKPMCEIKWKDNIPLETLVYNVDFVKEYFQDKDVLKGIFTLGEEGGSLLKQINNKQKIIEDLQNDLTHLNNTLNGEGGKKNALKNLEDEYINIFWNKMEPYKNNFIRCSLGCFGKKEKYKEMLLIKNAQHQSNVTKTVEELNDLYKKLFSTQTIKIDIIPNINFTKLLEDESNAILSKKIVGKDDVDIASLIKKLDNSSWVKQGISFYEKANGICPFCQQKINRNIEKELQEYFDDTFTNDVNAITKLYNHYKEEAEKIEENLKNIKFGNNIEKEETIKLYLELISEFKNNYTANLNLIKNKKDEPSRVVSLNKSNEILEKIEGIINNTNVHIKQYNALVDNLKNEQNQLIQDFWKFLIDETSYDISNYIKKTTELKKAIISLEENIKKKESAKINAEKELRGLEEKTTNINVVCKNINDILSSFGFNNFKLQALDNNSYKLIRPNDNSNASNTLSEGEKNFLTFLYFYNLINGSISNSGIINKKIIVLDDPVSSLDNEILFIVSSLIRNIIFNKDDKFDNVKQIFILTHNVYFYKEVVYNHKRAANKKLNTETFHIISKQGNCSKITPYDYNPIKTSYELLWKELKENSTSPNLPNCMRRILENYFKILGGIPIDNLEDKFEGDDKIICRSLCSWINDGSHSCFGDEFYYPLDNDQIIKYKNVFREIFNKHGHISHYNMMMGIENNEEGD